MQAVVFMTKIMLFKGTELTRDLDSLTRHVSLTRNCLEGSRLNVTTGVYFRVS